MGESDLMINGIQYQPDYIRVAGSPEFESTGGYSSMLFIKGQKFENIRVAYDIVSDKPLLVQEYGNGLENRIELFRSRVDSFTIGNHLFINPAAFIDNFQGSGYYEKVSSGNIMFVKKYRKAYIRIYDNQNRGKYSPQQNTCYLLDSKGKLTQIKSRQSFVRAFPLNRQDIRHYLNENKINFRKSSNSSLRELMNFSNSLVI